MTAASMRRREGQVALIQRDGRTTFFGTSASPQRHLPGRQGRCIVANIGNGQVQALHPRGHHEVLLTEAEGMKITTPIFPSRTQRPALGVQLDRPAGCE